MSCKVFVVGSSGYIGEGVALAFRRNGYKVFGLIRDEKKSKNLLRNEIIPIIGDQSNPDKFKDIIAECSIIVDAIGMNENSEKFLDYVVNIKSKQNSSIHNYKSLFIFTSGIMTYGPGFPNCVVDETIEPTCTDPHEMLPRKKFEEKVLSSTIVRPVVLRPGFVYGGNGGVIAELFFGIKPDDDLVLYGSKTKRWSWVHIDDVGDAYVRVAKAGNIVDSQIFNIAAQDNPTYEELKLAGAKSAGWKGKNIKYLDIPENQQRMKNWEANVIINPQKAFDLLGWKPNHVGIIQEMDLYYKSWLSSRNQ